MGHLSAQTKLETVSSHLHYYVQKQVQLLSLLSMNKCIIFYRFQIKVLQLYFLFPSALLISLNLKFIGVLNFFFVF
jgi:hypothetical protein